MSTAEEVILHGNEVFAIEVRGFDHIPEPERNMTLRQVDQLWVGASLNLLAFALGAIAVGLGLSLWLAFAAVVLGTLPFAYIALGSIITTRAGLPVSTLARAAFGMRGNLPNALLSWLSSVAFEVINTIFGVDALISLFTLLGWKDPGAAGKLVAVLLLLVLCGGIAVLGHATMVWFQRAFGALIAVALLLVIIATAGKVDWATAAVPRNPHLGIGGLVAAFIAAAAIVASNPISFLFNGPDWVRYLPGSTPARSIFHHVFWPSFIPTMVIGLMGAYCATLANVTDPVAGLRPFLPVWLFLIYILAVIGGSVANSVPTYYSSGLSLQALGLRLHRHVVTALDVVTATAIALYILFVQDFSAALDDFVSLLMVWVGPFGGVWICDGWLRRGRFDAAAIHSREGAGGSYWGWRGLNLAGCGALVAGMVVAALSMRSEVYTGPLARLLGGADLSWIIGFPVAAVVYRLLARFAGLPGRAASSVAGEGTQPAADLSNSGI